MVCLAPSTRQDLERVAYRSTVSPRRSHAVFDLQQAPPRPPHIWIVDDSPLEIEFTSRILGNGYEIDTFADGTLMIERLMAGEAPPDLVLLDWVMPGMTGDEVCRFLRQHPRTQTLPIIFVTASRIETSDVVNGLAAGANDYVPRPFAPEELRARVTAAIRAKQLGDASLAERQRLAAVNRLSHALLTASTNIEELLQLLSAILSDTLCDGCSIMLLPGHLPQVTVATHRGDPSGDALAAIAALTDPVAYSFVSRDEARATLNPTYHPYIDRFGLSGLAVMPFPIREPLEGVVTVTRDGCSLPFAAEDLATIETCIEYTGLAITTALRFRAEHRARAQLDAVLGQLPIGIFALDVGGKTTLVNAAAQALLPSLPADAGLDEMYDAGTWTTLDGTQVSRRDWRGMLSGHHAQLELAVPGREARTVALSCVPLFEGGGVVSGQVIVIDDVSAQRAVTVERERVAEFQTQMLAIVGHDLRNPLGAILTGTALIAEQGREQPRIVATVRRVENSALRIKRIVEQLLDMTRARLGGGIPVMAEPVPWRQLLAGVVDEATLTHPSHRFVVVGEDDAVLMLDPDRMAQVLSNLMSNAVQYGETNGTITVTSIVEAEAVRVSVHNRLRDNPLAAPQLATLFDPYQRGQGPQSNVRGLGLGLYIVRELVRAHGGTIDATSTDDGTTFTIVLPRPTPADQSDSR
ncbi:MAG TPA: response regulator [Kofleriaceae bacterium]|nr:response regulator [Kofleriaceae bacterium]